MVSASEAALSEMTPMEIVPDCNLNRAHDFPVAPFPQIEQSVDIRRSRESPDRRGTHDQPVAVRVEDSGHGFGVGRRAIRIHRAIDCDADCSVEIAVVVQLRWHRKRYIGHGTSFERTRITVELHIFHLQRVLMPVSGNW